MDIILYNIVFALSAIFLGYIFGSFPSGVFIGKVFYKKDPRDYGSKNSGGTNVGRIMGKKAGAITIILDILKTAIPIVIVFVLIKFTSLNSVLGEGWLYENGVPYYYLTALGTCLGHIFPIFAGFKGGKVVSSLAGFIFLSSWAISVVGLITFLVTLKSKKYVSLSSILTSVVCTIAGWGVFVCYLYVPNVANLLMNGNGNFLVPGLWHSITISIIAILLIVRHRSNIARLLSHQERKITWMK